MLVLGRKIGESIQVDGGIVITVVNVDRGQVKIGIEAPKDVRIMRTEIAGKAKKQQRNSH